jgi:hypothetical protein
MPVIALHTNTIHGNHAARMRLLAEAQQIISDESAPAGRRQLAAQFVRSNRDPLGVAMAAAMDVSERLDGWIKVISDDVPDGAA